MSAAKKGRFTIRSAGLFFILSGIFELFSLRTEVPLLGGVRGGSLAVIYHLVYVGCFLAMGIGLWGERSWAPEAVFAGTLFYTLDKVQYLLGWQSMEMQITKMLGGYQEYLQMIDMAFIMRMVVLMTLVFVACWWGFAGYIYLRRDYFRSSKDG